MIKRNLIILITGFFSIVAIITIILIIVYSHKKSSGKTCDASNNIENGDALPCTSSLADGSTCNPTCTSPYTLTGNRSCKNGTLNDTAKCNNNSDPTGKTCDASNNIENGDASPCTSSLSDGSTCNPTCTSPYTLTGNRSCNNGTLNDTAKCNNNSDPTKKYGTPTNDQLDQAKNIVNGYSKLFSGDPFIMFVNYTSEQVVARIGSGNGIYPCSDENNDTCKWGNNPGISKVHKFGDQIITTDFDKGINKSHQILNPNECWLVKIPLDQEGYLKFCNGNNDNATGAISCGPSQNLYFAYGLTGNYYDIHGKKYTYDQAIASNIPEHQIFPECQSNSNTNLAVGNQSQLELHLLGDYSATDLSSVNGVSKPLYIAMYDSKTGYDFTCTYGNDKRNFLYCDYDRQNCEFPEVDKTYQVKRDKDGLPYNCLQPGVACKYYVDHPKVVSVWGDDLDAKFTFTDPHGTTWNTKGCVPGDVNNYCTEVNGKLQYMGMDLQGGSCELLNAGGLRLNYKSTDPITGNDTDTWIDWTTGKVPKGTLAPAITKDLIWNKYQPECGNNFGSISDRLRMCKYDIQTSKTCPISGDGSCRTNNGTGDKDSWSSPVVQRFCESCHSETCSTYCQSYDDYWGTMTCPFKNNQGPLRPNVVVITY